MLELADVKKADVVYDLASGDGRIMIRAAKKYDVRGVGIEIDQLLLEKSRKAAAAEGVSIAHHE
jgi:cyclopropane fatty-acyl-phospholipid synthase-like methyltransferase